MKLKIPQATALGYIEVEPFGVFDWQYPESLTRRARPCGGLWLDCYNCIYNEEICGTITTRIDAACEYFVTELSTD